MKTRKEQMTSGGIDSYRNFIGNDSEYQEWYGILGRSRDSGIIQLSNFEVGIKLLGGESDDVRIERYGHWACGWIEGVYVRPGSRAESIARQIDADLVNYPILDEEDYSRREYEAAADYWDSMTLDDRVELCRNCGVSIFAARCETLSELSIRAQRVIETIEAMIQ